MRPIPHGLLSLIPAGIFFGVGLFRLPDYGMTWDEAETFNAAASNLNFLRGIGEPWAATHVIPGYYFIIDVARGFFVEVSVALFGIQEQLLAQHAFTLFLASACLAFMYLLTAQISGSARIALYTSGCLALLPAFVGHSQNNPKDIPAVFAFLLASCCIVPAARTGRWRWVIATSLAVGLALNTRILCLALFPIFGLWIAWRVRNPHWNRLLLAGAGGLLIALVFWPWLWSAPIERLAEIAERIQLHRVVDVQIVYLGKLQSWTEMPWHYRGVHLAVALPLIYVFALLLAIPASVRASRTDKPRTDLIALGGIWILTMALLDLLSPYHYDGIRHFLAVLPAVAIFAAVGLVWFREWIAVHARSGWAGDAAIVGFAALAIWPLVFTHPYQSAYLNPIATQLAGNHAEEWLELEYWGATYKAGARWINENTPPEALVYVPIGEEVAQHSLRRPTGRWKKFEDRFPQTARPQYLMFITRVGWYDPIIREIQRDYEPVHTIEIQNATLLEIYFNRRQRNDG